MLEYAFLGFAAIILIFTRDKVAFLLWLIFAQLAFGHPGIPYAIASWVVVYMPVAMLAARLLPSWARV